MCGVEVPFGFSYVPTIHIGGGGGGGGSGGGYVEKLMWCTLLCELEHMALSCREWECEETSAGISIVLKDCFSIVFSTTVFCVKLKKKFSFPCYLRANSISSKSFFCVCEWI